MLAAAEGFREMGFGYFRGSEHTVPIDVGAIVVMIAALLMIVCSSVYWPSPPPPPRLPQEGRCGKCGYLLRGLRDARCPECGKPFDASLLELHGEGC